MLQLMFHRPFDAVTGKAPSDEDLIAKVRRLFPDWFYPALWVADHTSRSDARLQQRLDEADALARAGLEKQIVATYRKELAEHIARMKEQTYSIDTADTRPMTEGSARRARMQCLKPNEEILKRIVTVK